MEAESGTSDRPSSPKSVHSVTGADDNGDGPYVDINFPPERYKERWMFWPEANLEDVFDRFLSKFPQYDWHKGKLMLEKGIPGIPKRIFKLEDSGHALEDLRGAQFRAMAPKESDIQSLAEAEVAAHQARERQAARQQRASQARAGRRNRPRPRTSEYTFGEVRVLEHLPNPQRSRDFLKRLMDDPGIRAAMEKHKFKVGTLMEMDPLANTSSSHEGTSRILGLNRNAGQVIELRLRTDAYDGYRDYKTIRNTLCHELAHNVHGPHDRNFWDLCHQIEREVAAADWKSGGRSVGDEEFAPSREEDHPPDHGGWEGGQYVLGTGIGSNEGRDSVSLSPREIRARAAEKRAQGPPPNPEGNGSGAA